MIEIGSRARSQAPPLRIVCESLSEPNRDPSRPWLHLRDDEQPPTILAVEPPHTVLWSSIWICRPDAVIRFDLSGGPSGTNLRWIVCVEEPAPADALVGHMCKRMNELINTSLRYTYGQ